MPILSNACNRFVVLVILFLISVSDAPAQTTYQTQEGDIDGARFTIAAPGKWSGHLLLIAHGLREEDAPLYPGLNTEYPAYRNLLTDGWMIAATSYRRNGIIVVDAVEDIDKLRKHIIEQYGKPERILVDGSSMGGTIAVLIAETRADDYHGALAKGASLTIRDLNRPFHISSTPKIPLLFLSNQDEIGPIQAYAEQASQAPVTPAVWEVKRDGHVNINDREHEAALRALDQFVETGKIERNMDATIPPHPAISSAEFKDGGAYCRISNITTDFGNINTDLIEKDLQKLGITLRSSFTVTFGDTTVSVVSGTTYGDAPRGEWVGFISWEGTLRLARNYDNAAKTLGCQEGGRLFIKQSKP